MSTRWPGAVGVLVLLAACGTGPAATDDGARDDGAVDRGPAADPGVDGDAPDGDISRDPGPKDAPAPADLPRDPGPPPPGCRPCTEDGHCGDGLRCLPVGATKHCLAECEDDGDCPPSYLCYAASTASRVCLPVSYNCVACAGEEPCPDGRVCNFTTGNCDTPKPTCARCTYDFDCAAGARCLKEPGAGSGACVPGCSDAVPCADDANFTCGTTAKGVRLCLPRVAGRCGGCPVDKPYPAGDGTTCWECLNDSNCDLSLIQVCDPATHACIADPDGCGSGLLKCDDGFCKQCCRDEDCLWGNGPCVDGLCTPDPGPCGQCADPFPICAILDNVMQCVQCKVDADCARLDLACHCSGDPGYACLLPDGSTCTDTPCGARCTADGDCPAGADGAVLQCSVPGGGVCFDARGWCDALSSCCGPGQSCHFLGILTALLPAPVPGFPDAVCTCDDLHPCLGGGTCHDTADLCAVPLLAGVLCPDGTPPDTLPAHLCTDLAALLGGR